MQYLEFVLTRYDTGVSLPNGKLTVKIAGTSTLATVYDSGGAPITQPIIADGDGLVGFQAANGLYDLYPTSSDGSYVGPTIHKVQLYDTSDLDADLSTLAADIDNLGSVLPYLPTPAAIFAAFDVQKYYDDGAGYASFDDWLAAVPGTFTRGGTVHPYFDATGLLVQGSANTPRFSYAPADLAAPPLLLNEWAASNDYAYSQEVYAHGASGWLFSSTGVTQTDNAAIGLDGTMNAGTIMETATTGGHLDFYYCGPARVTTGQFKAWQLIFAPVNGRTKGRVTGEATCGLGSVDFDTVALSVSDPSWHIEAWTGGVYRLWKSWTVPTVSNPVVTFQLILRDDTGATSYLGDVTKGFAILGVQMETVPFAGAMPSTYIHRPTTAAVTRAADALQLTLPAGVDHLTFTFGDNSQQVVPVSPGSYAVPTSLAESGIKSLISVDLSTAGVPVTSVSGHSGPAVSLVQADVDGLTSTSTPTFAGLATSGPSITIGSSILKADAPLFQWTSGGPTLTSAARAVIIGAGAAHTVTSWSNSAAIGSDAARTATTIQTSLVIGDTAAASAASVTGVVALGNEAGNGPGTLASGNVIGNATKFGGSAGNNTQFDIMGQTAFQFMRAVNTVGIGWGSGKGTPGTPGSHSQSVLLGSKAGMNMVGDRTGNILVGYNVQAPTTTTDNYMSFGDVLTYLDSADTITLQTPAAGKARIVMAGLAASPSYANDAAAAAGGVAIDELYRNGSVVMVRVT